MSLHCALGIQPGGIIENAWTVLDVSYSESTSTVYAHCARRKTPRSKWEQRVMGFKPLEEIEYKERV